MESQVQETEKFLKNAIAHSAGKMRSHNHLFKKTSDLQRLNQCYGVNPERDQFEVLLHLNPNLPNCSPEQVKIFFINQ